MSGCARAFDLLTAAALGLWLGAAAAPAVAEAPGDPSGDPSGNPSGAPGRVVSINLCTDQLAMLLAAPGQLVSVSHLALDPRSSAMAAEAAAYPVNHGQAEEVFLLAPDLVLAGTFTPRATLAMLDRLGIPVVTLAPAGSLADVREGMIAVGRALGRGAEGAAMARRFDADLAVLKDDPPRRPRAALYYANGYTLGGGTLSGEILAAAGFDNIAAEAGLTGGGVLPLERLVLADPDFIVMGESYPGASRAEELLTHPALRTLMDTRAGGVFADRDWLCGTPHVLRAVAALREARRALETAP